MNVQNVAPSARVVPKFAKYYFIVESYPHSVSVMVQAADVYTAMEKVRDFYGEEDVKMTLREIEEASVYV